MLFSTQGQVTLKQIVQYDQNSSLSKILCLSWKPASQKKLQSKPKGLCPRQDQVLAFFSTQGPVTQDKLYNMAKIRIWQNFMPVQETCMLEVFRQWPIYYRLGSK